MSEFFYLHDGYKDQQSGESITFHKDTDPWAVRITLKNPGSLTIASELIEYLEAIDSGLPEGFYHSGNIPSSMAAGEFVVLYFKYIENNRSWTIWYAQTWSDLLSQVEVLHDAFPPYLGWNDSDYTVVIDSPDFEAPNGIWNHISSYSPEFTGSTFKIGPRVYGDIALKSAVAWPPRNPSFNTWEPFIECPNLEMIEYQGDLGDRCERILASNLVYTDADGFERVDAYPSGGKPRVIEDAIGPLKSFKMDSGSNFPSWDCSQLIHCIRPVIAEEIVLPTRSSPVSLPIGPDLRNATELKVYTNGILNVVRGEEDGELQECPLVFGLKLLGVYLPDSVERVVNGHMLYRHQQRFEDVYVGIEATPRIVKMAYNFNLGVALQNFWDNNEHESLLMPAVPKSATYANRYAEVIIDEDYTDEGDSRPFYYVTITPDNELKGLTIPKIEGADKLIVLDGHFENTFSYGRTGELSFSIPGGPSYSGDIVYHVPAPPHHQGITIRNLERFVGAYASGQSFKLTPNTQPNSIQLAYGRVSENGTNPVVGLNLKPSWFSGSSSAAEEFRELIDPESYYKIYQTVFGFQGEEQEYEIALSVGGFTFEPFDSSGVKLAINWQDGIFWQAQVDPTSIDNILIGLNEATTKIDGAYRGALKVASPMLSGIEYMDHYTLNEPLKADGLKPFQNRYTPNYTLILGYGAPEDVGKMYTYRIEDIDIPTNLLGKGRNTYNVWSDIFSWLIYGDQKAFKDSRGIPTSVNVGGSATEPSPGFEGIGSAWLNWTEHEVLDRDDFAPTLWKTAIQAPLNPDDRARDFGVGLFRDEIPLKPDMAPLYGDPIRIDFTRVGTNYVWDNGNDYQFREDVAPETVPFTT